MNHEKLEERLYKMTETLTTLQAEVHTLKEQLKEQKDERIWIKRTLYGFALAFVYSIFEKIKTGTL
jgi:predicted RNase H-like nuclease (RuvC/YqgF family)